MTAGFTGLKTDRAGLRDVRALTEIEEFQFGRLDARCGVAGVAYVRQQATEMCSARRGGRHGDGAAQQGSRYSLGAHLSGHTEYIAELCGATESRMLLASEKLCTDIHVTTHVALRRACDLATPRILRTIELGDEAMKLLGFARPRIAVCGLNPHAGEHGLFGKRRTSDRSRRPSRRRGARESNAADRTPETRYFCKRCAGLTIW